MTGPVVSAYSLRYASGSGRLFAGEHLVLLVPEDTGPPVVDALWAAVQAGDVTTAASVVLVAKLHQAVILSFDGERVGVLLRGDAEIVEPVEHSGQGSIAFREIELETTRVVARLGRGEAGCDLPLAAGVVGAEAFDWTALGLSATRGTSSEVGSADDVVADVPVAEPAVAARPDTSAEALVLDPTRTLSSEDLDRLEGENGLNVSPALDEAGDLPATDSYDRLFGATSMFMPPTPVVPEEIPAQDSAERTSADRQPPAVPAEAATGKHVAAIDERSDAGNHEGGLIDGVPSFLNSGSSGGAARPAVTPRPGGVPGPMSPVASAPVSELTVARPPKGVPISAQSLIQAVHCPKGHPNPAESVTCRLCGAEVPSQSSVTVPRPPLGVLVGVGVPEGAPELIELDRSLILGRKPFVDEVTSSVPRLVVVDSPDGGISRQHAKVVLDGWHVLVADLGSRYGTVVQIPGEDETLLHPKSPVMITPGTTVTLAEVVTYRFQAQP
jgi:hypothetical protein